MLDGKAMPSKYSLSLLDRMHYILLVGSAYQNCFLIIMRDAIFIGYQTAFGRSESAENGASLKPI